MIPRWRRWLRWALAVGLLGLLALTWLLSSETGLRFLLARVQSALPGLRIESASGSAIGPLQLQGLSWERDGLGLQVSSLTLDWQPAALALGELRIRRLQVGSVDLQVESAATSPAPTSAMLPAWSWPLPDLPLAIAADRVEIGPVRAQGALQVNSLRLHGLHWRDDRLGSLRIELDTPQGVIHAEARPPQGVDRLSLHGQLQWQQTPPLQWSLDAGSPSLRAQVGTGGDAFAATLAWNADSTWQGQLRAQEFDARPWWPALPASVSGDLRMTGDAGMIRVSGGWPSGPWPLAALDLQARAAGERWQIERAQLQPVAGGELSVLGQVPVVAEGEFDLEVKLQAVEVPQLPSSVRIESGTLRLQGTAEALQAQLQARLSREDLAADLDLEAGWRTGELQLRRLLLDSPQGRVQANGEWRSGAEPVAAFDLQARGFDPGWLLPTLPGQLDADLRIEAGQQDSQWRVGLRLDRLHGQLRGQALAGQGQLDWNAPDRVDGELELRLGSGGVRVSTADAASGQVRFAIDRLRLADLGEGVHGVLDGWLQLPVSAQPDAISADLVLSGFTAGDLRLDRVSAKGGFALAGEPRRLQLRWSGLHVAEGAAGSGQIEVNGVLADYQGQAEVAQDGIEAWASWRGQQQSDAGKLALQQLRIEGERWGSWALEAPVQIRYGQALSVSPGCLRSEGSALCLSAVTPVGDDPRARLQVQALPLQRLLRMAELQTRLQAEGKLDASIELGLGSPTPSLQQLSLQLDAGQLRAIESEPVTLLGWNAADLQAPLQDGVLRPRGRWQLDDGGYLDLDLALPRENPSGWSAIRGHVDVQIEQLRALALLAPDLVDPEGRLQGRLEFTGDAEQPVTGTLALQKLGGAIPALGLRLRESELTVFNREGRWQLDGMLDTGEGIARVEGEWGAGDAAPARLRVAGRGVRLASTPRLQLQISPELDVQWRNGGLRVRGEIGVDSARVDLERLEAGTPVSTDVRVLDPEADAAAAALPPLDLDVRVRLGDAVQLAGFGFDGGVSGELRVRERPGRAAVGRGSLDLRGNYRAYGQDLEIERGRLLFAASALDNPGIDLRARRELREVTVGIAVRGAARRPQLSLWSEPALDQAEALSYLVLGRPLRSASEADGAQLGQAAATIGGNLLASKIGSRLGFDTFGVADSSALGGAAFTVGKYLSPRLYLGYGVSLFDSARAVSLRYLINEHLDVELESARESRAGLNYRTESDHGPFRAAD